MREPRPTISLELPLYLIVFVFGTWLRLSQIDRYPLTDAEASEALAALPEPSEFGPADLSSQSPAYMMLTGLAFTLSGAADGAARWVPAIAGAALVLTPLIVQRQLGRGPAFLAAILFAVSPTLWTASRTAGGATLAAIALLAGVLFLVRARSAIRGNLESTAAMLGLAAISGPAAFSGLVTIGAGSAMFGVVRRRRSNLQSDHTVALPWPSTIPTEAVVRSLALAAFIAIALATGLGFFVGALRGVFDGLGTWAEGWFRSSGVPAVTVLLQLPAYEPLALVLGGAAVVRALKKGRPLETWLACWTVGAILAVALYAARQPEDILWIVTPLTILAAGEVSNLLDRISGAQHPGLLFGFVGAVVALLAFSYLQLVAFVRGPESFQLFLGVPVLLGLAVMGIAFAAGALVLLGLGWSRQVALIVTGTAGLIVLLALSLSAGAGLNFAESSARELWRPQASTLGLRGLHDSIRTLSEAKTGQPTGLPIQLGDESTPALAWTLRSYSRSDSLDPANSPPLVLIREGAEANSLPSEYLGQSVTIGERWDWTGWYPPDLLGWWLTRDAPTRPARWVILARQDVAGVEQLVPITEP